jgi:phage gp29-like protein
MAPSFLSRIASRTIRALSEYVEDDGPEDKPDAPEPGKWVSGIRSDYDVDLVARRATPASMGTLLREADAGSTAAQFEIFEEIERDPTVNRLYNKRRSVVTGSKFLLTQSSEDPRAQKATDLCTAMLFGEDEQDGIENWDEGLFDLSDAIGKAFAVAQISWEVEGGLFVPRRLERWPQKEFQLGKLGAVFEQGEDELWVRSMDAPAEGLPLKGFADGTWIVHRQKSCSAPLARAALFRSIAWFWLFKHFGMADWSIFLERYGIPPRMGTYPAGADDKEKNALLSSLISFGKDHAMVVPDGSTIEVFAQAMTAGATSPHPLMVDHCNKEIAIAIAGSAMAVDQGARGARSAKEAYQTEEWDQAVGDARNLASTIRTQLLRPIVRLNLGEDFPIPKCAFQLSEDEDLLVRAQTDDLLVNKIGLPLSKSYFYEKYDRPEPLEGEDVAEGAGGAGGANAGVAVTGSPFAEIVPGMSAEELLSLAAIGAAQKKTLASRWAPSRTLKLKP